MSSNTDDSGRERRDRVSPEMRALSGAIRRFDLGVTSGVQWKVIGYSLLEGGREVRSAEVFSGVGFYSRPKEGNNAEAIAVMGDGASNPIIVATRDEDSRKAVAQIGADQSIMFNSTTIALVKASTVEVRLASNPAVQSTVLGVTYRSAEDTLLTALGVFATAAGSAVPALVTPAATLNSAITAFKAAAASYLTQVLKAQ